MEKLSVFQYVFEYGLELGGTIRSSNCLQI